MKIMILDKKSLIAHAKMRLVYILNLYTKKKYHHTLVQWISINFKITNWKIEFNHIWLKYY